MLSGFGFKNIYLKNIKIKSREIISNMLTCFFDDQAFLCLNLEDVFGFLKLKFHSEIRV